MEHKFKVGDKVKVHYLMGNRIGYIQERKSELRYDIRYDEGCIGHDIEENRIVKYNGNQDMEINVGDKVRVSKDAPKEFDRFKGDEMNYEVVRINPSKTIIQHKMAGLYGFTLAIPCKYLVKVDAEAKEPKFKVGDVVRIKPDADKLHQGYQNGYAWLPERDNYLGRVASVKEIWCDGSIILNIGSNLMWGPIDLEPYTEPTTPTIKVGDFVRVLENLHEPICLDVERHLEITNMPPHAVSQKEWKVISVEMRRDCAGRIYTLKHDDSFIYNIPEDCVELVQPKEQTEAEKKPNIGSIKIPVEVDLTDSYWDTYTADLAKEIALKVANKKMDNTPMDVANYAVSVAKAVAENLKKK